MLRRVTLALGLMIPQSLLLPLKRYPVTTRRRVLLWASVVGTSLAPAGVWAKQAAPLPKIGILSPGGAKDMVCDTDSPGSAGGCLLEGLSALGYVDGRNVVLKYRLADGDYRRLPTLAAELAGLRPDVIYTHTSAGADAASTATTTIPIVVGPAAEATLSRLAGNLAHPEGNVTGVTLNISEQTEKCLQLLKDVAPHTSRVALLLNPDNPGAFSGVLGSAAAQLGITLVKIEVRSISDLPQAFAALTTSSADAIYIFDDATLSGSREFRKQVVEWALNHRLPLSSAGTRVAADGGLLSLGADIPALARRAAFYVHRILGGAKPADLPVERPAMFKLSVNLKTAKALGIMIPQSLLLRADEVIQ